MNLCLRLPATAALSMASGYSIILFGYYPLLLLAFLLLLVYPLSGLIFWLISELLLGNYQILGANPRVFVVISLMALYFAKVRVNREELYIEHAMPFIKIPCIVLVIGLMVNIYLSNPLPTYARWMITYISNMMTVVVIVMVVKNERDLRTLVISFVLILGANAMIGIMQHIGFEQLYEFRRYLGKLEIEAHQGRIIGLSRSAIEYAYVLLLGVCLAIGLLHERVQILTKTTKFLYLSSFLIIVALILNGTRSAIGGVLIMTLLYALFGHKVMHMYPQRLSSTRSIFLLFFLGFAVTVLITYTLDIPFILSVDQLRLQDTSAMGRLSRFQLAIDVLAQNPLGVGEIESYSNEVLHVWSKLAYTKVLSDKSFSIHNHFLLAFVFYGIIGGVLFLIYILQVLRLCKNGYQKASSPLLKSIFLGGLFLPAYYINIFFHNAGPLRGDNLYWFYIGLLAAGVKVHESIHRR